MARPCRRCGTPRPAGRCAAVHQVVVATQIAAIPPAGFDALGAGEDARQRFAQRLWLVQQPARTRPIGERQGLAGEGAPGLFGAWVGVDVEAVQGVITEAGAQALAQLLPALVLLGTWIEQLAAFGYEGRQVAGRQCQGQHRRGQLQLLQAHAGQLEEQAGVAFGGEQADLELGGHAAAVLQGQAEALYATVAAGQVGRQVAQGAAQRKQQGLVRGNLEVQFDARAELVRRQVEVQPQRAVAEQLVQVLQQLGWKAPGQAFARQLQHLAQLAQAHACQGTDHLTGQAGAVDR